MRLSNNDPIVRVADTEPLRIGVVLASASRSAGGLFNSVRQGALGLQNAGCAVEILAIEDAHSDEDAAAWVPLPLHLGKRRGPGALGYSPDLGRNLGSREFDVLHQHGIWQHISSDVSRWRRRTGGPVIISPRGMLDPWALENSKWKKRVAGGLYERRNLHGADCLHALNLPEAAAMRAFGLKNPIAIIPNGVNLPDTRTHPPRPVWLGEDHRKILLFLGRLDPKKGIRQTLDAWSLLKSSKPNLVHEWRLVIAGWDNGDNEEEFISHARQLDLLDDVVFPGPVYGQQKEALLSHAQAFILASFSEGMPMAVLEAWSHSLPVFMTKECNLTEGFEARAGIALSNTPTEMCKTLGESLGSPQLSAVGGRGRELVVERFTWEKVVTELLDVYRWLAVGSIRPDCVITS